MKLFSKEKGIILAILNGVLVLWILAATCICISNATRLLVKDYEYTYEQYKVSFCIDYETDEECKNNYEIYKVDQKYFYSDNKRNIIVSIANVLLVSTALLVLNIGNRKENN